jgi:hypothetical protein
MINELESPQAYGWFDPPRISRTNEDETCPECGGIKPWDFEECDECYELKQKKESPHE